MGGSNMVKWHHFTGIGQKKERFLEEKKRKVNSTVQKITEISTQVLKASFG